MILVSGGNGYVGTALCQKFVQLGLEPISISRKQYSTTDYPSLVGDVTDKARLEEIFDEYPVDTVVHLASMLVTASGKSPDWAVHINVMGSLNLMEVFRDKGKGAKRFIFGSSYNAIGTRWGLTEAVDEDEPALPSEFYGETKRFVEQLGISMAQQGAFEFTSARMSIIVGPGEPSPTSGWRTNMFNLLAEGGSLEIPFASDEVIPLAHFQEIANSIGVLATADSPAHNIYHLPSESWRVADLTALLEEIGDNLHVTCGNRLLTGIPPVVSSERLRQEFQYEPMPLRQRLESYKEAQS